MTKFSLSRFRFPKMWTTALVGSAVFTLAGSASAQFSTTFNDYAPNNTIGGTQMGWTTNDVDNGGKYNFNGGTNNGDIGGTDDVYAVPNFSNSATDYSATLGGQFTTSGNVPGHPVVTLGHDLALGTSVTNPFVTENLDFGVTQSSNLAPKHDSFGISITGSTGLLFGLNFVPSSQANFDNVTFSTATGTFATTSGFFLGTKLHLTLAVNQTAKTFSATIGGVAVVTNQVYTGGDLATLNVTWTLNDQTGTPSSGGTAYEDPGDNFIAFDNISTAVPEPSTYVMLGAGALCLLAVARRRVA